MGNVRNMMLQAYVTLVRGLACFKTKQVRHWAYYKEIIVSEVPPRGAKPYLSHGPFRSARVPTFYVWSCEVNLASVYLWTIHLNNMGF